MNLKQYQIARVIIAMVLGALVSTAVVMSSFILAAVAVVLAMLFMVFLKKQVHEVTVDERDYEIAGKSARWAFGVFSFLASLASFLLLIFRDQNPYFEIVGSTLAYSACFLMIIYSLVFKYYQDKGL